MVEAHDRVAGGACPALDDAKASRCAGGKAVLTRQCMMILI